MKIAIIADFCYPYHQYGGVQKYVYFLAKNLVLQGHQVDIISSGIGNKKIIKKQQDKINYILMPYILDKVSIPLKIIRYHRMLYKICKILYKENYDIIHSIGHAAFYYTLFFKKINKTAILVQNFDNESFKIEWYKKILIYLPINLPMIITTKLSDVIASCGPGQTKEILYYYGVKLKKIKIVSNGVDLSNIKKITHHFNKIKLRKKYNIKSNEFVIINVNRLAPTKRVDLIINALNICKDKINFKFILIGNGPEEEKLKQLIKINNLEKFFLHFKNLPNNELYELLFLSDIFVEASAIENIVLTTLEAMALKIPIISFHDQEGLIDNEKNGFICKIDSKEALAKLIIHSKKQNLKKIGELGNKSVQKVSWENVSKEAIKAYKFGIENKRN